MPNPTETPVHVLIVDDERDVAEWVERCQQPIRDTFPGAKIQKAYSWVDFRDSNGQFHTGAKTIIFSDPPPTIVLLDLTMPDSDAMTTLSQVPAIEDRSALLLVTGRSREEVEGILFPRKVEILSKSEEGSMMPKTILAAMIRALKRRASESRFTAIEGILERLYSKGYGPTPPTA